MLFPLLPSDIPGTPGQAVKRRQPKVWAGLLVAGVLGLACFGALTRTDESPPWRAEDSTSLNEPLLGRMKELKDTADALAEENKRLRDQEQASKERSLQQEQQITALMMELNAVLLSDGVPESAARAQEQGKEPSSDITQATWSREELCRSVEEVQAERFPDELQDWEVPPRAAVQLANLPPGMGHKLLCRDAKESARLHPNAPLCPGDDGSKWPLAWERDFRSSKRRHLASNCGSWCLYSESFRTVAYVWDENEPLSPQGCYRRVGIDHDCLTVYAEEHKAVLQWIQWDSCRDLVALREDGDDGGVDLELLEMSKKYNFTAPEPLKPETPPQEAMFADGINVFSGHSRHSRRARKARLPVPSVSEIKSKHLDEEAAKHEEPSTLVIRNPYHLHRHHAKDASNSNARGMPDS